MNAIVRVLPLRSAVEALRAGVIAVINTANADDIRAAALALHCIARASRSRKAAA